MINSPCKNCGDRLVTKEYNCHSHCQKYFDYISSLEEYKATIKEYEITHKDYHVENMSMRKEYKQRNLGSREYWRKQ